MTNREFTMLASLIARKASAWAHEGIHDTSRDGDTVLDDSASRFCNWTRRRSGLLTALAICTPAR